MAAGTYGLRILKHAVELRSDGRPRVELVRGYRVVDRWTRRTRAPRGKIRAWSLASAKRLAMVALNADAAFRSHVTLTYRARTEAWESDAERNLRVVRGSKADLHRFLRCLRREMGEYLWVQEFQARGVVHYHLLAEREISQERVADAWARASGQEDDPAVLRHGVRVDAIRSQEGARHYLGRYLGKERQKRLPEGVDGAGRWWGRSRSLELVVLEDIVWMDREDGITREAELRIVRILRGYIRRRFGWRFKGGAFLDFGGRLAATLAQLGCEAQGYYGATLDVAEEMVRARGWEGVDRAASDGIRLSGMRRLEEALRDWRRGLRRLRRWRRRWRRAGCSRRRKSG